MPKGVCIFNFVDGWEYMIYGQVGSVIQSICVVMKEQMVVYCYDK